MFGVRSRSDCGVLCQYAHGCSCRNFGGVSTFPALAVHIIVTSASRRPPSPTRLWRTILKKKLSLRMGVEIKTLFAQIISGRSQHSFRWCLLPLQDAKIANFACLCRRSSNPTDQTVQQRARNILALWGFRDGLGRPWFCPATGLTGLDRCN